ncbi:MAG: hypothetical protein JSV66_19170 [Trueperaceae bacterium]|nr:MAG: hypothetical protein JSV66_19170 [Trueperaceae bacterium]
MSDFRIRAKITGGGDKDLPDYLRQKIRSSVSFVRSKARQKGLETALEYELFELDQRVNDAINQASPNLARDVLDYERLLVRRIENLAARESREKPSSKKKS